MNIVEVQYTRTINSRKVVKEHKTDMMIYIFIYKRKNIGTDLYLSQFLIYYNDESKHLIKCYYGSEEEPSVKYQKASHVVEVLNKYIFIKTKAFIGEFIKMENI